MTKSMTGFDGEINGDPRTDWGPRRNSSASESDYSPEFRFFSLQPRAKNDPRSTGKQLTSTTNFAVRRRFLDFPGNQRPDIARQLSAHSRHAVAQSSMPSSCSQLSAQASQISAQIVQV